MCTAISVTQNHHYFGRTLDYETSFSESITITPRRYPFYFSEEISKQHYALIGMTAGDGRYPLYYDAVNEKGLCMAGLMFAGNARYLPPQHNAVNVASYELIPWLLSKCASLQEAKSMLQNVRITNVAFAKDMPPSPLHWMVADKTGALVIEPMQDGLHVYDNPVGTLTNNPPFPYHMLHLTDYLHLRDTPPKNELYSTVPLESYSRGMGAFGLPGDFSSGSRFVRATFGKSHIAHGHNEAEEIIQFFKVLRTVEVPRGYVTLENGKQVFTVYTSCCDAANGVYYCAGYESAAVYSFHMHHANLDETALLQTPLPRQTIFETML